MKHLSRLFVLSLFMLAACGGGGGGGASNGNGGGAIPPVPTSTPSPAPTLPASITQPLSFGATPQTVSFGEIASGVSGTVTFPVSGFAGTGTLTLQSTLPTGAIVPQSTNVRRPSSLGAIVTPLAYIVSSSQSEASFTSSLGVTMTFPPGTLQGYAYLAFDTVAGGWIAISGPIPASGTTLTIPSVAMGSAITILGQGIFAMIENGTPLPTPTPSPTPSPLSTPTPVPFSTPTPSPTPAPGSLQGPPMSAQGFWGPPAVANAFQYPVQSGYDGNGETVAIIMDTYPNSADLQVYASYFQIPQLGGTVTDMPVDGGPATGDIQEATLDTETIASLAPAAKVVDYGIPALAENYIDDAVNQIVSNHSANVISMSVGGCEGTYDAQIADPVFASAEKAGIAVVASSGDTGNECFSGYNSSGLPVYVPGVGFPASDPNVVGVGGNETATLQGDTLTNPAVWNSMNCFGQCASGGGVSSFFSLPSYQSGLTGTASQAFRNVPDVSMPADSDSIYVNGAWGGVGGTSWSAPEFAAMTAEVDQYCQNGLSNPVVVPYLVYKTNTASFIDVISGNNQFGTSSPYYNASPGYDNASGLGLPLGMPYAQTICPNHVPLAASRFQPQIATTPGFTAYHRTIDVTPRVAGLVDMGVRAGSSPMTIQIVLNPSDANAPNQERITSLLQSHGFTITKTFSNHLVIDASGETSAVNQLFLTTIHTGMQGRFGERYFPSSPVTIPMSISGIVHGVLLDNVVTMQAN